MSDARLLPAGTVLLVIAIAATTAVLFWWPPSWVEFWTAALGATIGPVLIASGLRASPRRWVRAMGILAFILGGGAALAIIGLTIGYVRVGGQLGAVESRERHDIPDSRTISLTYLRLPATTDTPSTPLVYLTGGPGGSGILTLLLTPRDVMFTAPRTVGDVYILEQRGAMPWVEPVAGLL